jgi:acyl-coenzyme A thioesterase PaaI-like protein
MIDPFSLVPELSNTPRARLAAALRLLIALTVSGSLDDDDAARDATAAIEALTSRLASATDGAPQQSGTDRAKYEIFTESPVSGLFNALAPYMNIEAVDGRESGFREVRGAVNFSSAYEGPPNFVHGGMIAATLDEALGMANYVAGMGAMTGTLTVRYSKPTPLNTDLRVEARCLGREDRKIRSWAGIYRDDVLTAEAEGLFIQVSADRYKAYADGAS